MRKSPRRGCLPVVIQHSASIRSHQPMRRVRQFVQQIRPCAYHNLVMRLFLGIPLATAVVHELAAISQRLRTSGDRLRWSAPQSWHITLQFLGNTNLDQYRCLVASLNDLRLPPLPIQLEGLGAFERTGVLFAGVKVSHELLLLHQSTAAAIKPCGFTPETRPFHPHITLARSIAPAPRQALLVLQTRLSQPRRFTRFVAEEFLLYESFLGPGGSRYEVRERFHLLP